MATTKETHKQVNTETPEQFKGVLNSVIGNALINAISTVLPGAILPNLNETALKKILDEVANDIQNDVDGDNVTEETIPPPFETIRRFGTQPTPNTTSNTDIKGTTDTQAPTIAKPTEEPPAEQTENQPVQGEEQKSPEGDETEPREENEGDGEKTGEEEPSEENEGDEEEPDKDSPNDREADNKNDNTNAVNNTTQPKKPDSSTTNDQIQQQSNNAQMQQSIEMMSQQQQQQQQQQQAGKLKQLQEQKKKLEKQLLDEQGTEEAFSINQAALFIPALTAVAYIADLVDVTEFIAPILDTIVAGIGLYWRMTRPLRLKQFYIKKIPEFILAAIAGIIPYVTYLAPEFMIQVKNEIEKFIKFLKAKNSVRKIKEKIEKIEKEIQLIKPKMNRANRRFGQYRQIRQKNGIMSPNRSSKPSPTKT